MANAPTSSPASNAALAHARDSVEPIAEIGPSSDHGYVADLSRSVSIGPPLAGDPTLGALTLPGFLDEVVGRFAEQDAVVEHRPGGDVLRWTYRDVGDAARAVAKSLLAAGLGKGERVGVLMTNRAEFLPVVFGTALAGGVATPLKASASTRRPSGASPRSGSPATRSRGGCCSSTRARCSSPAAPK